MPRNLPLEGQQNTSMSWKRLGIFLCLQPHAFAIVSTVHGPAVSLSIAYCISPYVALEKTRIYSIYVNSLGAHLNEDPPSHFN